jgi:hypothetical protein
VQEILNRPFHNQNFINQKAILTLRGDQMPIFGLGVTELILLLIIIGVIFFIGPQRVKDVAKEVASSFREFRMLKDESKNKKK